jgi:hypothetical protein
MRRPSKHEVLDYVADIAGQLAEMCEKHDQGVSAVLRYAAHLAKDHKKSKRKTS